jgi:hypothetical protein
MFRITSAADDLYLYMRAHIILCLLVASCSKKEAPPPALDKSKIDFVLDQVTPKEREPLAVYADPDRAYIFDIVESAVIAKHTGLTLCLAQRAGAYGIDAIAIARVAPGSGATWLTVYTRDKGDGRSIGPTEDGKVTDCFKKELGERPFRGIRKDSLGGFDYAIVAFRPLMLGRR